MQFMGSFKIPGFDWAKGPIKPTKYVRQEFANLFLNACGMYLADIAARIPVLTGTTRREVQKALSKIDTYIYQVDGYHIHGIDYASQVDFSETGPKVSSDYPMLEESGEPYKKTYTYNGLQVSARRQEFVFPVERTTKQGKTYLYQPKGIGWDKAVEGSNPGEANHHMSFYGYAGGYTPYTLYFSLDVDYWKKYMQSATSIYQDAPWAVMEDALPILKDALNSFCEDAADHFAGLFTNNLSDEASILAFTTPKGRWRRAVVSSFGEIQNITSGGF